MTTKHTRLRIVSDGTAAGTQVLTEDGTIVDLVTKVTWSVSVGDEGRLARATIEVVLASVDVVGDVVDRSKPPPGECWECGGRDYKHDRTCPMQDEPCAGVHTFVNDVCRRCGISED